MGQLVLQIGSAAAGFAIGGPTGAQIGWAIGGMLGNQGAAQQRIQGPSQPLMDLRITGSDYGQAIPYTLGTVGIAGQMWWNTDRRPTTTVTSSGGGGGGGKGGGGGGGSPVVETSTTTYDMDCLIGLTDCEILGISRIWRNGFLIYTASALATDTSIDASEVANAWTRLTVYTGASDQLPDPTYEAAVGATLAPAYRGRGSVFIESLKLGSSGQVPNLIFEVVTTGAIQEPLVLCHFNGSNGDTTTTDEMGNTVSLSLGAAISTTYSKFGASSLKMLQGDNNDLCIITGVTELPDDGEGWTIEGWFYWPSGYGSAGGIFCAINGAKWGIDLTYSTSGADTRMAISLSSNGTSFDIISASSGDLLAASVGVWRHIALVRDNSAGAYYLYFDGVLNKTVSSAAQICPFTQIRVGQDRDGVRPLAGYVDEFRIFRGCKYPGGTTFTLPTTEFTSASVVVPDPPTIAEAVTALCLRAGMTAGQIDVTDLSSITRTVKSLAISQVAPTRQALELLMSTYFFEMTASDKLYFVPRGGSAVDTIPFTDLGATTGSDVEPLPLKQVNDLEIPAQIAITYINIDDDYQTDTQYSDRLISATAGTVNTVNMAIGMTPDEAKSVADVMLLDRAASSISTEFSVLMDYCALEPTDPVVLTGGDGSTFRMRIVKRTDSFPLLKFEAVLDDVSILTSQGITSADYDSQTEVAPPVDTIMELLDIPILQDGDNDPGFYVATQGTGTPYQGAAVFQSPDDVTYTRRVTVLESAIMGNCITTLGDWTGPRVFDEINTVTVDVGDGVLNSSTRDAVLASYAVNAILIGDEMIQFVTATMLDTGVYQLSRLLRGCRGTEWAMTGHTPPGSPELGERAIVLSQDGIRRIILNNSELGVTKYYKAVTLGRALSSATGEPFIATAVGLKPFSIDDLRAARDTSNNITFTWQRRTRLSCRTVGTLGISIPLGEDVEAYEIDIYSSSSYTTVVRTITASTTTAAYSAAEQTADGLTPGNPVYTRGYQMSSAVGRGYALEQSA